MTFPMYVSPEQLMKDRADFARKGIARGRSVLVLTYVNGIAFVAENPSTTLHKVSEIYDRIAFAAVGKYPEFENLRVAGIRYADLRGFSYDRSDVTARGLANAYAQTLGTVFTQESKPYEVELAVAQVGRNGDGDQLYRLTYDGSVTEERGFVAMGGASEALTTALLERWQPDQQLDSVLTLAVDLLSAEPEGEPRQLDSGNLEVAVLDRRRPRRTFRRIGGPLLDRLLDAEGETRDIPTQDDARPGLHDTLTGEGTPRTTNPETQQDPSGEDRGPAST